MLAVVAVVAVLTGTVTIGPSTPVCRAATRCERPAPRVVLTFSAGSRTVRTTTDAQGTYVVKLAPGTYSIEASKGMRVSPVRVTVRAGGGRRNFAIDTGIR
jgi:hypothetical protein